VVHTTKKEKKTAGKMRWGRIESVPHRGTRTKSNSKGVINRKGERELIADRNLCQRRTVHPLYVGKNLESALDTASKKENKESKQTEKRENFGRTQRLGTLKVQKSGNQMARIHNKSHKVG